MKEDNKRFLKRILIAAFIYANIFTISFLFGVVSHLQDTIAALLIDRANRLEREQEVSDYLRIHDETDELVWPEQEEDLVL